MGHRRFGGGADTTHPRRLYRPLSAHSAHGTVRSRSSREGPGNGYATHSARQQRRSAHDGRDPGRRGRREAMKAPGAAEFVPEGADLARLRQAACHCRGCDLYQHATQTVFGAGPADADVVVIGEQPGDQEDVVGQPFVGPAGRLLDRALAEADIDRDAVYVTNAVKHFKFVERGKRRIHKTPGRTEVVACSAWLDAELDLLRPRLVVCLGAIAAQAVLGPSFKVSAQRGEVIEADGYRVVATVHPSAVLRAPDRAEAYAAFVADLRVVRAQLGKSAAAR
ncbi:UdgX family uracil-DNA binding protein [Nocardia amamiensis]|uniref:UdgX family uracil-DNA binding protein n=1 Tax=Nocardia amamiensis TaxID=404578 RepID=UPI0033E0BADB